MATADKDLLARIRKALPVWNVSSPAESLIELLPKYRDDYQRSLRMMRAERDRFIKNLNQIHGVDCFPSQANFVLCKVGGGQSPHELAERLLTSCGLLIKPLSGKAGLEHGGYVRLAVLGEHDNNRLVKHIASSMESVGRRDAD
jgi:histidinol-phosphate/aromatic aminotransferase/cobyric acid decarboxylase-like protein